MRDQGRGVRSEGRGAVFDSAQTAPGYEHNNGTVEQ